MSRLVPSSPSRDEECASELESNSVPVLLYCRPSKSLPYVFCGELGNVEIVDDRDWPAAQDATNQQSDSCDRAKRSAKRPFLVWSLLDHDRLMAESEHFQNLVRFSEVGI